MKIFKKFLLLATVLAVNGFAGGTTYSFVKVGDENTSLKQEILGKDYARKDLFMLMGTGEGCQLMGNLRGVENRCFDLSALTDGTIKRGDYAYLCIPDDAETDEIVLGNFPTFPTAETADEMIKRVKISQAKVTPQPGVPPEEAGAAVAVESASEPNKIFNIAANLINYPVVEGYRLPSSITFVGHVKLTGNISRLYSPDSEIAGAEVKKKRTKSEDSYGTFVVGSSDSTDPAILETLTLPDMPITVLDNSTMILTNRYATYSFNKTCDVLSGGRIISKGIVTEFNAPINAAGNIIVEQTAAIKNAFRFSRRGEALDWDPGFVKRAARRPFPVTSKPSTPAGVPVKKP